jgi:hypothetical protein
MDGVPSYQRSRGNHHPETTEDASKPNFPNNSNKFAAHLPKTRTMDLFQLPSLHSVHPLIFALDPGRRTRQDAAPPRLPPCLSHPARRVGTTAIQVTVKLMLNCPMRGSGNGNKTRAGDTSAFPRETVDPTQARPLPGELGRSCIMALEGPKKRSAHAILSLLICGQAKHRDIEPSFNHTRLGNWRAKILDIFAGC